LGHIPTKDKIIDQLKDLASNAPLLYHIQHQIHDHHGRPVAVVGPITKDLDGHIAKQIAENIAFPVATIFVRELMVALVEKYNLSKDAILNLLYKSPLFHEEKRSILSIGIDAYLKEDAIIAIHLLVPQAEDAVRRLVELSGGSVIKFWRTGGFSLKTFDELLRHESIAAAFGKDAQLYLRVLYTDPRGLNLRNDVCHGNKRGDDLGMTLADRVFHSLLLLSLAREKQE
jgi:hypothetical protein